jgi:hypothetical protein
MLVRHVVLTLCSAHVGIACLVAADGDASAPAPAAVMVAPRPVSNSGLDLRLDVGGLPGITTVKDKSSGTTTDISKDGGGDIDIEVIYVHARPHGLGFAAGGGLFAHSHVGDYLGLKPQINASGVEGQAALVYRFTPAFHIEAPALVLGLGSAQATKIGVADSDRGGYGSVGLQAGAYYTFRIGIQVDAAIGVMGWSATVNQDNGSGGKDKVIYSGGGGYLTLGAGYRF